MRKRCWVSSFPTSKPEAKWTPEEDIELLELAKKYHGRWDKVSGLTHTPFECNVRCFELHQEKLKAKIQHEKELRECKEKEEKAAEVAKLKESVMEEVLLLRTELEKVKDRLAFLEAATATARAEKELVEVPRSSKHLDEKHVESLDMDMQSKRLKISSHHG